MIEIFNIVIVDVGQQERLQNVLQILLKHKILLYDGEETDTLPNDAILALNLNYQRFAIVIMLKVTFKKMQCVE